MDLEAVNARIAQALQLLEGLGLTYGSVLDKHFQDAHTALCNFRFAVEDCISSDRAEAAEARKD